MLVKVGLIKIKKKQKTIRNSELPSNFHISPASSCYIPHSYSYLFLKIRNRKLCACFPRKDSRRLVSLSGYRSSSVCVRPERLPSAGLTSAGSENTHSQNGTTWVMVTPRETYRHEKLFSKDLSRQQIVFLRDLSASLSPSPWALLFTLCSLSLLVKAFAKG